MAPIPNEWLYPMSEGQALAVQRTLAEKISLHDALNEPPRLIAGFDVSNNLFDTTLYAAVVVLDFHTLEIVDQASVSEPQHFPYIPGLLGFREAPALIHAFEKLRIRPDLCFVDGHGISHPRRLGIASHLGLLLDLPTIGVAKSILVGHSATELGPNPGENTPLLWKGQPIATLYRTKKRANPLILSPGHKVSFKTVIELTVQCLRGYRLPEPTRQAHLAANACRLQNKN